MTRIALVEDNHRLAGFLRRALGATGIESDLFTHIETAWAAAQQPEYGLFVIDRGLPDGGGLSLVKRFRSGGHSHLMVALVKASGETVRRTALEAAAWGLGVAVTPNALDVALHRLKRKLQAIGSHLQIVNSRGYGYALREISPVR